MTLLYVSEPLLALLAFVIYALIALKLFVSWLFLRKVKKNKDLSEDSQMKSFMSHMRLIASVILVSSFLIYLLQMLDFYLGPKYFIYILYVVIVCGILAYITIFILTRKGKVKIDGIKYWLDKRNGTARVLSNKYSGDIFIPSSFMNPKDGTSYRVTDLDDKAFAKCSKLTSVTIPEGVTSIYYGAFWQCKQLKHVYCYATTPPKIGLGGAFYSFDNTTLHVPNASIDAYKTTAPWSQFKNIVAM